MVHVPGSSSSQTQKLKSTRSAHADTATILVKYLNVLTKNLWYMAASKETGIHTRAQWDLLRLGPNTVQVAIMPIIVITYCS